MKKFAKNVTLLIFSLLSFANLAVANNYDSIEYSLSLANIQESVLKVEVTLKGKFEDKLILNLPSKWAGTSYIKQITNVQVSSNANHAKLALIEKDDTYQAIIGIPNLSDQIKISYEIHQKPDNPSNVHEAIIRDNLVHAPGYGIFATPDDLSETTKIRMIINWRAFNQSWKTISSYGISSSLNLNITVPELLHAVYVAGKIRIYKISDHPNPVFLSLYEHFDIEDQKIVSDLSKIINSQKAFFNDFDFQYYAISLIEGDDPSSMGGTMLFNCFSAFLPKGVRTADYYMLFAHEHLHNWIGGGKIRNNEDEELNYWWTEGFTEFYSRLIALRSGGIDAENFIKESNQLLRQYYLSPVNRESNLRIKKDFWKNHDIEKLPYYRGFVFAIYLNNMIKQQNHMHSLDNVMHDLFQIAPTHRFSSTLFKNIARRYMKGGIENEFSNFIDQGHLISLANIKLPMEKIFVDKIEVYQLKEILSKNEKQPFNDFFGIK